MVEYHEAIRRELETLKLQRQALEGRRTRAIKRRQREKEIRLLEAASKHCQICEGTGWKPAAGGVMVCDCRKGLGPGLI